MQDNVDELQGNVADPLTDANPKPGLVSELRE